MNPLGSSISSSSTTPSATPLPGKSLSRQREPSGSLFHPYSRRQPYHQPQDEPLDLAALGPSTSSTSSQFSSSMFQPVPSSSSSIRQGNRTNFSASTSQFRSSRGPFSIRNPPSAAEVVDGFESFLRAVSTTASLEKPQSPAKVGESSTSTDTPVAKGSIASKSNLTPVAASPGFLDLYSDPELLEAQRTIRSLTSELSNTKTNYERKIIDLEKNAKSIKIILDEANHKISKLDQDRVFMLERDKVSTAKIKALEAELASTKQQSELKISQLQAQNRKLHEDRAGLEDSKGDLVHELNSTSAQSQRKIQLLNNEVKTLTIKCQIESEAKGTAFKRVGELELQLRAAEAEIDSLRSRGSDDSLSVIKKQLQDQIAYINTLETANESLQKEARYLRDMRMSVDRLNEEKLTLTNQLRAMDGLRQSLAAAQMEIAMLLAEKKRWTSFLEQNDDVGIESPYALTKALASERLEIALLKEQFGADAAKVKGLEAHVAQLEERLQEIEAVRATAVSQLEEEVRKLKRSEKSRELGLKEIQFLREQLRSYDMEEMNESSNFDPLKLERIRGLEELLSDSKSQIQTLEQELKSIHAESASSSQSAPMVVDIYSPAAIDKISSLEIELADLKKENALLKKENKSLDDQVGILEKAVGRGEYDSATTRIVQLLDNPELQELSIRQDMLNALKGENQRLLQQISNSNSTTGLVPVESLRVMELESKKIKQALEEKDRRFARLKDVYKDKAQEFKEAVFSLLGYEVDFQEGRVRLKSTFANEDDASFLFASNSNDSGTMQLVGGSPEATASLDHARQFYIAQNESIPAFLASVTLSWWERKAGR
ncbi:coiled-coil domain-containing protein mad1 [Blyttiomyces sp. JEL0837]|nr:coiled-coil domain-containing protein mad1 [Blyttiomyces sp. JEL0837]